MHSVRSDGTANESTRLGFDVMFHNRASRSVCLSQSEHKPHFAFAKVSLPGNFDYRIIDIIRYVIVQPDADLSTFLVKNLTWYFKLPV